jgi:hypothetical protein
VCVCVCVCVFVCVIQSINYKTKCSHNLRIKDFNDSGKLEKKLLTVIYIAEMFDILFKHTTAH